MGGLPPSSLAPIPLQLDGWLDGVFDAANVEDLIGPASGCGVGWRDSGRGRNDSDVRLPPESANGKSQDLTTNSVSAPWAKASTSHASTTRSSNSMSRRDFSLGCSDQAPDILSVAFQDLTPAPTGQRPKAGLRAAPSALPPSIINDLLPSSSLKDPIINPNRLVG